MEIIDPTRYLGWDELLLSTPGYSFFHSSAWARVLAESYGYTPPYFAVFEDGKLRALVPLMEVNSILTGKRGVSLPFTDYCEPIVDEGIRFQDLLDHIIDYGKKRGWKYVELRGGQKLLPSTLTSATYLGHILDLAGSSEKNFSTFRKGTKSAIKKAEKEQVKIKISTSNDSLNEFYKLNCSTRKSHGLPPQPLGFFKDIHQHILKAGLGITLLAFHNGVCIAGAVFFHFGDKAIYKYGASKQEYQILRANNLIIWNSIKYYSEKGCKKFCFGRTELENEGLRIFKTGWGTEEHNINYYKYDLKQASFVNNPEGVSKFQNIIIGKTPIPLLKIIGSLAYRHMG